MRTVTIPGLHPAFLRKPLPVKPLPWHTTVTIRGSDICIRPIEHRDIKLYDTFIHNLPDDIQRNRLGIDINHFSSDELIALCDVDYHDSMAFVAVSESDPESAVAAPYGRRCSLPH